jgi:hypothetical protein
MDTNYITTDYKAIDSQQTIAAVKDFFDDLNFPIFSSRDGVYR